MNDFTIEDYECFKDETKADEPRKLIQYPSKQFQMLVQFLEESAQSTNNKKLCTTHWIISNREQQSKYSTEKCHYEFQSSYATLKDSKKNKNKNTEYKIIHLSKIYNQCIIKDGQLVGLYEIKQGGCIKQQTNPIKKLNKSESNQEKEQEKQQIKLQSVKVALEEEIQTQSKRKNTRSYEEYLLGKVESMLDDNQNNYQEKILYIDELFKRQVGEINSLQKSIKSLEKKQNSQEQLLNNIMISYKSQKEEKKCTLQNLGNSQSQNKQNSHPKSKLKQASSKKKTKISDDEWIDDYDEDNGQILTKQEQQSLKNKIKSKLFKDELEKDFN